ncbi:hypothetical protein [Alicyclobacillus fodiniaquatilis]|uniref:Uncharacterized protein n=1 Tax=Alicyclobacillus fodiniaquatilis TaxID=1661150 RepID=A0ABW4JAU1_9BACL
MRTFDQLDWVHRWDDFEMMMYVQMDGTEHDGIYMQVLRQNTLNGVEEWEILYDRRLSNIINDIVATPDDPAYEDVILRKYLNDHPDLVMEEKQYLAAWLDAQAKSEEERQSDE